MTVAIMGYGAVGEAMGSMLPDEVLIYDPPKSMLPDVTGVRIAFICVPAPTIKGVVDLRYIQECLEELSDGTIVVIRSTVPPGTTDALQREWVALTFIFVPEFLTEATRFEDAKKPNRVVIGIPKERWHESQDAALAVRDMFPHSQCTSYIQASAAEMAKYAANAFYALKVAHFNQLYDLCLMLEVPYDQVMGSVRADPWTGAQHTVILHGGDRGFGGKCLPKDVAAISHVARQNLAPLSILDEAVAYNTVLRGESE